MQYEFVNQILDIYKANTVIALNNYDTKVLLSLMKKMQ